MLDYIILSRKSQVTFRVCFFTKIQIRILIRQRIFHFFTKIWKQIILIHMIHSRGGFFGSHPEPDTLDTWSEAFLYYGSEVNESLIKQNKFNTYNSYLTTLLIFTAFLTIDFIRLFLLELENRNTNRTCTVLVHKDKTVTQLRWVLTKCEPASHTSHHVSHCEPCEIDVSSQSIFFSSAFGYLARVFAPSFFFFF